MSSSVCAKNPISVNTVVNGDITYYAYYNVPFTLTFNGNGGTGHSPTSIVKYAHSCIGNVYTKETVRLSPPSTVSNPSRTGYAFK